MGRKLIIPVLAALFGAIFAASLSQGALYQWSRTASSNATADPTIGWAEGMSPSSVNDSARAMMARIAEWRDDMSGLLTTAGTSTAFTVTTNQGLPSPPTDGQAIAVTFNADNGASPTLAADGGTAYAIQSSAGTAISPGTVLSGSPYILKFKLASSAWVLHGFFGNTYNIPLGGMIDYFGTTAPNSNFVFPSGQCINRTTYSAFFVLVGTTYGVCDGANTFGVPDLRGRSTFGKDDMGGSAASRITAAAASCTGTTLGITCGGQTQTITTSYLPASGLSMSSGTVAITGNPLAVASGSSPPTAAAGVNINVYAQSQFVTFAGTVSGTTANMGSGTGMPILPPLMVINKVLRIF